MGLQSRLRLSVRNALQATRGRVFDCTGTILLLLKLLTFYINLCLQTTLPILLILNRLRNVRLNEFFAAAFRVKSMVASASTRQCRVQCDGKADGSEQLWMGPLSSEAQSLGLSVLCCFPIDGSITLYLGIATRSDCLLHIVLTRTNALHRARCAEGSIEMTNASSSCSMLVLGGCGSGDGGDASMMGVGG